MYLIPFATLFPEIAKVETRSLTPIKKAGIPDDDYGLFEAYCPDPTCDCQRVLLNVVSRNEQRQVATISFGFDRSADDAGPYLDPYNPQGPHAEALLDWIARYLDSDPAYVQRLKGHYAMVKDAAADPDHPAQKVLAPWNRESNSLLEQDGRLETLRQAKQALARLEKEGNKRESPVDLDRAIEEIIRHEKVFRDLERGVKPARHKKRRRR